MADKKIRLLVKAEVNKAIKDLNKTEKSTNKLALAAKQAAKAFAGLASVAALGAVVKSSVQTSAQFETLETRLVALKGSVDEGRKSFDFFNKVAATTPFQLANVVEAGAQLEAFGADSTESLKAVSDLAAFMGTDIVDAANAFGRAFAGGAGAADVLRDRGVLMQVKLKTGFDDLSKMTLPQFQEALVDTLTDPEGKISGATDLLSQTFSGLVSNFQDSVSQLQDSIGDILAPVMKSTIKILKDGVDSITESFRQLSETELETTIRRLKEIGSENEAVQKALLALEERSRKKRVDALTEQLEGVGSIKEISEEVLAVVDSRARKELELGLLEERREELAAKGFRRTLEETRELNDLKTNGIKDKEAEIAADEKQLVILNNQILTRKQYNDLIESGVSIAQKETENVEGLINIQQEVTKSAQDQLKTQIQQGKISAENALGLIKNLFVELATMRLKNALQSKINAKKKEELATSQAIAATSAVGGGFLGFLGGLFQTGGSYMNRYPSGGSFNVNKRTILPTNPPALVGDNASGMERIDVTPLPSPNQRSSGNIVVNINAPVVDEFVVDSIIPAIRRAEKLNL